MYSVEFDHDVAIVTSMDEEERHEDLEVMLADEGTVYIRQWDESFETSPYQEYQLIVISYQQLLDLVTSLQQTEGLFKLQYIKGKR
tara:strand:- start:7476 stop:7733 length:258 start_codon:yes stop_codon:yes gene_type:complete